MKRIFVIIGILLSIPTFLEAKTLEQIRWDIRYKINDSTNTVSSVKWSDAILNQRINDVQRNVCQYTRCIYVSSITTPVAETREYSKPPKCISIDRVSFLQTSSTSSYKKLEAATMGGLDVKFPTWEYNTSGRPLYYYERGAYIGFDRAVSSTYASTGAVKVDYFKYAEDMDSDDDIPFDGITYLELYHDVLVLGVSAMCLDDSNSAKAAAVQSEYLAKVNLMLQSLQLKSDQQVQKITIGQ